MAEFATALTVLVTALITLVLSIRNRARVNEIHVMVNSQREMNDKRIAQLTASLAEHGIVVPPYEELSDG